MTIQVLYVPTSDYVHDEKFDWFDYSKGPEEHHLGFSCPHDYMMIDDGAVWCPDCDDTGQGLTDEDINRAFAVGEDRNE